MCCATSMPRSVTPGRRKATLTRWRKTSTARPATCRSPTPSLRHIISPRLRSPPAVEVHTSRRRHQQLWRGQCAQPVPDRDTGRVKCADNRLRQQWQSHRRRNVDLRLRFREPADDGQRDRYGGSLCLRSLGPAHEEDGQLGQHVLLAGW